MSQTDEKYRDSAGKVITAAEAEQEYRKSLIVAGKPLEGPEYDAGLEQWLTTYTKVSAAETRAGNAGVVAFFVAFGIVIFVALISAIAGGGILAFIIIAFIGGIMSFGVMGFVMLVTTPSKS